MASFIPTRIPFRLTVLKNLTTCLEGINPDNGFEFDMRPTAKPGNRIQRKVFRGRAKYGKNDPIPMLSILEAPIPQDAVTTRGENELSTGAWELLIQGFCDDDLDDPSDPAHCFMAEVKAQLVREKRRERGNNILGMQGRISEMYIGQGSVRPADEASDKGFFWLTLTIRLVDNLADPYA